MTTKKTQTQTPVQMWDEYAKSYSDAMLEMTRRNMDQAIAMSEQIAGIWMDAARKTQAMLVKESEAALKLAEEAREQARTASEQITRMMGEFSAN